ncbi:tellurite resistance TerB family protein [Cellulophaga sp. BC115SP]|uniref:tellurite resistance TerB family protein n=1 Tax=Cellulophaga sp. BC115SP TaxID=2683263 RepID=UPI00141342B8|nr:tellurite resistance TerB family protein [Cellulophaga sp. BC115SP]NBB26730.1 TerB family tellurite resistance protein [Cellulophaga sp. BC115SP]
MGIFDKFFKNASSESKFVYTPKSEQEAWVAILYACAGAEGNVSDVEIEKISSVVVLKTLFNPYKTQLVPTLFKPVIDAFKQVGSKALIDSSAPLIADENKATLFCLVFDLLLADGTLGEGEKEIAEYLIEKLNLDSGIAEKIIEVLLIKNKYAVVIRG